MGSGKLRQYAEIDHEFDDRDQELSCLVETHLRMSQLRLAIKSKTHASVPSEKRSLPSGLLGIVARELVAVPAADCRSTNHCGSQLARPHGELLATGSRSNHRRRLVLRVLTISQFASHTKSKARGGAFARGSITRPNSAHSASRRTSPSLGKSAVGPGSWTGARRHRTYFRDEFLQDETELDPDTPPPLSLSGPAVEEMRGNPGT
jgi:hypothetical protein